MRRFIFMAIAGALLAGVAQAGPRPPALKPYRPLAVTHPAPIADPAFAAFRRAFAAAIKRRSESELTALVVTQGFFRERDFGGSFEASKTSAENFTRAFHFGRDNDDWERLGTIAAQRAVSRHPSRAGVICTPAEPAFDEAALEQLYKVTDTNGLNWAYPMAKSTPVRSAPRTRAALVGTLTPQFVRTMGHAGAKDEPDPLAKAWVRILLPTGKAGYVAPGTLSTLYVERLCFQKDPEGVWRIAGYVGGGD